MKACFPSSAHFIIALVIATSTIVLTTGCPGGGTFTPPPALKFTNVTSSAGTADIGENILVSWEFEEEDLLEAQRARLISLTFEGLSTQGFVELDPGDRALTFDFDGPCIVELVCDDDDGEADRVAFEIGTEEAPFMRASVRNLTANGYPRLGATTSRSREIVFHQFFGAFDPNSDDNGQLDDIAELGLPTGVAFRGFSFSPEEDIDFDLRQGSGYQLLSILDPSLGVANSVVYGGGFSYDGEIFTVKTDDGEVEGTRLATVYEAIFMTIVLQTFETIPPVIVDIQLGNIAQGMVVALNTYGIGGRGVNSVTLNPQTNLEANGTISGSIKSGVLGMPVTDVAGNIFDAFVEIQDVAFQMPFLRDDDLASRLF